MTGLCKGELMGPEEALELSQHVALAALLYYSLKTLVPLYFQSRCEKLLFGKLKLEAGLFPRPFGNCIRALPCGRECPVLLSVNAQNYGSFPQMVTPATLQEIHLWGQPLQPPSALPGTPGPRKADCLCPVESRTLAFSGGTWGVRHKCASAGPSEHLSTRSFSWCLLFVFTMSVCYCRL